MSLKSWNSVHRRSFAAVTASVCCVLALAACSSSTPSGSAGSSAAANSAAAPSSAVSSGGQATTGGAAASGGKQDGVAADFNSATVLAKGYAGDFSPPPSTGPNAVTGKKVWFISCGQLYVACAAMSAAFTEAGNELGWTVTVQDSKADGTVASTLLHQAIAANVDGVALVTFDCPLIKGALLAAKQAKLPVVNFGSSDCNDPAFGGAAASEQPLFTATVKLRGSARALDYFNAGTDARADYIVAKLGAKADILDVSEQSQLEQKAQGVEFGKRLKQICPGCKSTTVPFTFSQVPNPATQIWQSGIQAHPTANVVTASVDSLMPIGLQSAIAQSGRKNMLIGGGEGDPANFDLIRAGKQSFSVVIPYPWIMWGLADTLNRIYAGGASGTLPDEGAGFQFVDAEHNLPSVGALYQPTVDYRAAYKKVWHP